MPQARVRLASWEEHVPAGSYAVSLLRSIPFVVFDTERTSAGWGAERSVLRLLVPPTPGALLGGRRWTCLDTLVSVHVLRFRVHWSVERYCPAGRLKSEVSLAVWGRDGLFLDSVENSPCGHPHSVCSVTCHHRRSFPHVTGPDFFPL